MVESVMMVMEVTAADVNFCELPFSLYTEIIGGGCVRSCEGSVERGSRVGSRWWRVAQWRCTGGGNGQ